MNFDLRLKTEENLLNYMYLLETIGPNKDVSPSSGDRRLAQSAQMYHYQHQKNQIIAMENQNSGDQNGSLSDIETDEENEEGDYTVYECPGLAPVRILF